MPSLTGQYGLKRLPGRTVGLMGGSFNPAHEGHLHISRLALKRFRLDHVWWLVSPQNPLKAKEGMAGFEDRFASARLIASRDRRIRVTGIEMKLGSSYTAHTLAALKGRYPKCRFVWIMGADNLEGFHRWYCWREIFQTVPIAVFARPTYTLGALASKAARTFKKAQVPSSKAKGLASMPAPAWVFNRVRLHAASSTEIRSRTGGL